MEADTRNEGEKNEALDLCARESGIFSVSMFMAVHGEG
jgi:hypothetical protein